MFSLSSSSPFFGFTFAWLVLAVLLAAGASTATAAEDWRYPAPERIVAFADVHGAFDELTRLLRQAGILDEDLRWSGGATHLVSLGDLLDRGARSRDVVDLLMRLEDEAATAGGAVHVVLGNHELMNLTGELDYVSAGEYASFAGEEDAELRERAYAREVSQAEALGEEPRSRVEFDAEHPAGYFALRAAYAPDGHYGRWLLQQPVLLQLGDTVFVHGGLPGLVSELGGEAVNATLGADMRAYAELFDTLLEHGRLTADVPFGDRVAQAREAGADPARIAELERLSASPVFDPRGPLWYRGNALCNPVSEIPTAAAALERLDAARVVIGHTPTPDRRVTSRLDGRVIMLDTGMLASVYRGRPAALIIEADRLAVLYAGEAEPAAPQPEARQVGSRPAGMDDDALEAFLRTAEVLGVEEIEPEGMQRVTLARDGVELHALFDTVERRGSRRSGADRWRHEIAAYRLDRLLDLRLVPVTVERRIEGASGALQLQLERSIDHGSVVAQEVQPGGWCPLSAQYNLMWAFDALIYNDSRTESSIHYTVDDWMLRLTDHSRAFRPEDGRPPQLAEREFEVGAELARRLATLDRDTLEEAVGDLLDRDQLRALRQRRDALLE